MRRNGSVDGDDGLTSYSSDLSDVETLGQENEVFLSFRGTDTRKGFTDYLYRSLYKSGVRVFRDNENLRIGEEIGCQLVEGIKQSKICIPIFSKNYAESKWCLKEFALMMDCMKTMKQIVLPIFYDVTPDEVQHQAGKFKDAFDGHEKRYGADTVQPWRNALSQVGSLKGWELEKATDGKEGELVDMVVDQVMKKLKKAHIVLKDTVIGIEEQVDAVTQLLEADAGIVGIWGTGGIGKTTLAKAVYNQIVHQFDRYCFLENIREKSSHPNGLESLQSVLVSQLSMDKGKDFKTSNEATNELKYRFRQRKVLILLDDVDNKEQIEALGGRVDWFALGSRIIVTTRDSGLFDKSRVKVYETKLMDKDRALQLFCNHAFKAHRPPAELRELSEDIVKTIGGLPLALEVIGGLLAGQEIDYWESIQEKLQSRSHEEFEDTLSISYDALTEVRKRIFLDIACFHIGEDVEVVNYLWTHHFRFPTKCDVKILESMSLIKIKDGKLGMHDHLRDFGRAILESTKHESITGNQIWLWDSRTAVELLRECTQESQRVEAIFLHHQHSETDHFTDKEFRCLSKLRFIRLYGADLSGSFQGCLSNLRWLDWQHAPFKCIPSLTHLSLKNLVVLKLSNSCVEDEWNWSSMQVVATLKVLDLSRCHRLRSGPDFSLFPKLERLQLSECSRLNEINSTIGKLRSLEYLDFSGCKMLYHLPREMGYLESLVELHVCFTRIRDLPISRLMKKLQILCATKCRNLSFIDNCIGKLTRLTDLRLGYCGIRELPESIEQLTSLVELHLQGLYISTLPKSIGSLGKLKVLDASDCKYISKELPDMWRLCNLEVFKIDGASTSSLPETISDLSRLHTLHLGEPQCWLYHFHIADDAITIPKLETLPQLPVSLISIVAICRSAVPIPNLSDLTNLRELELHSCTGIMEMAWDFAKPLKLQRLHIVNCPKLKHIQTLPISLYELRIARCTSLLVIQALGDLISLKIFDLRFCSSLQTLPDMSKLKSLKLLKLMRMEKLCKLVGLESLDVLEELVIEDCVGMSKLSGLSNLKSLHTLKASECESLQDLEGLHYLETLKELSIKECKGIERLPNLSNLKLLKSLCICDCEKLQDLEGLDSLEALKRIYIDCCNEIKKLGDLSNSKLLATLYVVNCEKLQVLEGLDELEALSELSVTDCTEIKELPNLSNLKRLQKLETKGCEKLQDLVGLDELEELRDLNIKGCKAIRRFPNLSKLKHLKSVYAENCENLQDLEGLDGLEGLLTLEIAGCKSIRCLPNLSNVRRHLRVVNAEGCERLEDLEGLFGWEELRELNIEGCKAIRRLPNLSNLKYLENLNASGCENLQDLEGLDGLEALWELNIAGCKAIRWLPDLSNLKKLFLVNAEGCEMLQQLGGLECLKALQISQLIL